MDNKSLGLLFTSIGSIFLILSIALNLSTGSWIVFLVISIILNITGTAILMRDVRKGPNSV